MKVLIADDEKPARGELRYMLGQIEAAAEVYEARTADEALRVAQEQAIDVVFLDINMPGRNGLAAAAALLDQPNPPLIVFATAYDVHAVRAFELAALDYLVKPFSEQRLAQTIVRVRQALAERSVLTQRQAALRAYVQSATGQNAGEPPGRGLDRLWGRRENNNGVLVDYAAILWVAAEDKRIFVQTTAGDKLEVGATLKELEERLAPHHIVRVHKTYLVNLRHVAEIVPWFSGAYLLRLDDAAQTEIPLSRQYARVIKELAG